MIDINKLLTEDQKNIRLFQIGEIGNDEIVRRQNDTAKKFFTYFKKYGFPCKNENNQQTYRAAITLTLHQPLKNLKRMYEAIESGETCISPSDLAFIIDKIRVQEGDKQEYGTQYQVKNRSIEFFPIRNPTSLDARRTEMNLEPHAEYRKKAEQNVRTSIFV